MKSFKISLLSLGMTVFCFAGNISATFENGFDIRKKACDTAIKIGYSGKTKNIYVTAYVTQTSAGQLHDYAHAYACGIASGKSEQWAAIHAAKYEEQIKLKKSREYARAYASAIAD